MKNKIIANYMGTQPPAVQFYRFYQMHPYMRSRSIKVNAKKQKFNIQPTFFEMAMREEDDLKRLCDEQFTEVFANGDLFICQRLLSDMGLVFLEALQEPLTDKKQIEAGLKKKTARQTIITDIDDTIFDLIPTQIAYNHYKPGTPFREAFIQQMKMSDGLIVSTDYLAKTYVLYNDNIEVIKNTIDVDDWEQLSNDDTAVRILWSASTSHDHDLEMVYPHLLNLKEKHGDKVEIILAGGIPPVYHAKDDGIIKEEFYLPFPEYRKKLASYRADIGIAPLLDNEFNRCKSNLRFLEYSALGLHTVCSDVEPFKYDIEKGMCTPAYCEGSNSWFNTLDNLVESKQFIDKDKLINYITTAYNPKKQAKKYQDFLIKTHRQVQQYELDDRGSDRTC